METKSEVKSILYVISTTKIGGAETALKRILEHIDKTHYQASVLVTGEKGPLDAEYKAHSEKTFYLNGGNLEDTLIEKIREGRYDILHFFNSFEIYKMLPKIKKIKTDLRIISSIMISPRIFKTGLKSIYDIIRRNEKHLYAQIVDSENVSEFFPCATIIKNSVNMLKFKPADKDPKLVVWIGRLSREKGAPVMLDIAKAMPSYKFVMIVGSEFKYPPGWKPYQDWIDNAIKNRSSNVEIKIGISEDDVVDWLSKASFFIMTSVYESLPISIIEAMACGCAVLVTNVGDIPKIINHGKNGFIIPHQDIAEWQVEEDKAWLEYGVEKPRIARTPLQYHFSPKSKRLDEEIKLYVVKTIPTINVAKIGKRAKRHVKYLTIESQVKRHEIIYDNTGLSQKKPVLKKRILKANPEISILTTSYQRGAYIEECIRGVEKQRSSRLKINHIIVDAGSTDDTSKILKKHKNKIDYYIEKGVSQVSSLNFMMDFVNAKYPNTDYIGWINADDWYEDNWLIESLNNMGKFDITTSQYFTCHKYNIIKTGISDPGREYLDEADITDFLSGNRVAQNTVLIKKHSFDTLKKKTGYYFNPEFDYTMDYELWVRALRNGFRIKRIRKPLSNLRIHDLQLSTTEKPKVLMDVKRVQVLLEAWEINKRVQGLLKA